jgi:hypothetical protein
VIAHGPHSARQQLRPSVPYRCRVGDIAIRVTYRHVGDGDVGPWGSYLRQCTMSDVDDQSTSVRWRFVVVVVAALGIACSSSADTSPGAELFARDSLGEVHGCSTCHSVSDRPSVSGPALLDIGLWAGGRVEGISAEDYLRESILAPAAHFADGWGEGMPSYAGVLTADEVEAIVDYLASLR